jgi:hypothetical protein
LIRAIKLRAVRENRKLKDLIADLLRRGLAAERPPAPGHRVQLPLIHCAHIAGCDEEMIPERVADALIEEEAGGVGGL